MTHNDILRRLRYAFDISDSKMMSLFALADSEVSREQISDWLKKDDDPAYKACKDIELATFLNGFINDRRGKKEGPQPEPEKRLSNNMIFRKLRIALNLQSEDIIDILKLVDYRLSNHELSAFFRKPDHRQYRDCKDQVLRNFLHGLQLRYRPDNKKETVSPPAKTAAAPEKTITAPAAAPASTKASPWHNKKATTPEKRATAGKQAKPDAKPAFKWQQD